MAYKLSNVYRDKDKESQGGLVGLRLPNPDDPTKTIWVHWPEEKFVEMFTKGDEKTKEILNAAMFPERTKTKEIPDKPKPPFKDWDYQMDDRTRQVEAPRSGVATDKATSDGALSEIMSHSIPSPDSPEGQERRERKEQGVKITGKNINAVIEEETLRFNDDIKKQFGFITELPLAEAQERKVDDMLSERFNMFAGSRGFLDFRYDMIDKIRKAKDPRVKQLIEDWEPIELQAEREARDKTAEAYNAAKIQMGEAYANFNRQVEELKQRVNEEEKERYLQNSPKVISKRMNALADAEEKLEKETVFDKETGETTYLNPTRAQALKIEIEMLRKQLGIKGGDPSETKETGKYGVQNEGKKIELLKKKGMNPAQIDAAMKAYAARGN